jgi:hypothetical protein
MATMRARYGSGVDHRDQSRRNVLARVTAVLAMYIASAQCAGVAAEALGGTLEAGHNAADSGRVGSLIGIQYEQWFMGPQSWKTAEAVPLLGRYTTDESTVAQHYAEFEHLGFDWLLIDWSNMLWAKPDWELHSGDTGLLEEKTAVLSIACDRAMPAQPYSISVRRPKRSTHPRAIRVQIKLMVPVITILNRTLLTP